MSRRKAVNEIERRQIEHQQKRSERQEQLNRLREWAYLQGQNVARKLFSIILQFKRMPAADGLDHQADFEAARGFADGLNLALDDLRGIVTPESRKRLLQYLIDDLVFNSEKAENVMGEGWVSPWIVHVEKLRSPDGNGRRLKLLTSGLYRQFQPFDAGRCLTGLNEDFRAAAIEMLDSFSRHGRHDRAFMDAAEAILRGEEP